ncbi:hypothetical protein [Lysobacter solisilvae (ex Woo and Kim 2020)]|uniref:Uncharacterized protein n=1 Tax=Agrilutibacter terrestris TaxID=2865112 RepID=A0A7H0FWR5_9GAMM|nr:hypothetical protein [Lysobacter terrestris]QNP40481.1 hypothetical protein H8B22_13570 [Lysobacter terrestris]
MSPESLLPGEVYYHLRFADPDMTVPAVEPVVYIGVDVFPDEDPDAVDTHYFQDALSYRFCGSAAGDGFRPHPDIEPLIHPVAADDIGDSLLDLDGVIAALTEARRRTLPIQ